MGHTLIQLCLKPYMALLKMEQSLLHTAWQCIHKQADHAVAADTCDRKCQTQQPARHNSRHPSTL